MFRIRSSFCFTAFLAQAVVAASLPSKSPSNLDYANVPISFEANIGQADSAVAFLAHGHEGSLLLTPAEAWLSIQNPAGSPSVLRLRLHGANANPVLEGLGKLRGVANYFTGSNPGLWHTNVATFAKVKYHDVYPGVDLIYYGNQQKLEYDIVVQPGADPGGIALEFVGAEKITLNADGDLLLQMAGGTVRQHKPVIYQEIDGTPKMVSGNYVLSSSMRVGFQIADYDPGQPLVIDPVLALSATYGGSALNQGLGIAVDSSDNVYVTGVTSSSDFPTDDAFQSVKRGSQCASIVKFDANGAVMYSTYLGGGLTNDITTTATSGLGIAVDASGDAFVTGFTTATNFPTKNPFQSAKATAGFNSRNAFVAELNPAGNALVYSTYLGGNASDTATGIALDTNGSAIVTGYATSPNFPTTNAAQAVYGGNGDAFVTKFSADGTTLVYSTYLGGSGVDNQDESATGVPPLGAVAVDSAGNAYVTGATYSTNFPVLKAFQPTNQTLSAGTYSAAFVTKINPTGNLVFSTYFGGMQGDLGRAIGVDHNQKVYFAGNSKFGDLPTTNAFQAAYAGHGANLDQVGDAFVAALDATGTNLLYCTYLGGHGDDQINGIAVRSSDGAVAVTGFTDSPDFPLLNPVQATAYNGVFKSGNGATSWAVDNNGLASSVVYSIQIDPSNPANIYALTPTACFKSTDGGAHWASANSGLLDFFSPSLFGGGPAGLLVLDPLHPATLYAGTFEGVYKTTNGAATWSSSSTGLPSFADIQTLAIDPTTPTTLYAGTDSQGIFKSVDGGNSWTAMNSGLTIMDIISLLVDPNNSSNLYAGAINFSASHCLFKSTNGGGSWTLMGGGYKGGDVDFLVAPPGNPTTIYAIIGNATGSPVTPVLDESTDGGATWSVLLQASTFPFTALVLAAPSLPALSITGSGSSETVSWPASFTGYLLQSTTSLHPTNWEAVPQSPATNNGNIVVTIPAGGSQQGFYRLLLTNGSASSPPTIYMGTDQSSGQGTLKSTDGGAHWKATGPAGDTINALSVNPANPSILYAGLNGGRDGFVSSFTPSGQLFSSTHLGGSGADQGNAIASDQLKTVYVTGSTSSSDFPVVAAHPTPEKAIANLSGAEPLIAPPILVSDSPFSFFFQFVASFSNALP